jgi:hypothetical protein
MPKALGSISSTKDEKKRKRPDKNIHLNYY